jgi:hypothetical protein
MTPVANEFTTPVGDPDDVDAPAVFTRDFFRGPGGCIMGC